MDEKWFFLTREKERYLLHWDKKNPKHCVKHKSHITKVMFLCAVGRPRFNTCSNSWWDSKLEIGNLHKGSQKTGLREWWCGRTRSLLRKFIMIYSLQCSFCPYFTNGLGGTGYQGKFLFNNMEQKTTLVAMTSYSMMCWWRKASTQHSRLKQQTHLMSTYWVYAFLEPFKVSMMLLPKMKKN